MICIFEIEWDMTGRSSTVQLKMQLFFEDNIPASYS